MKEYDSKDIRNIAIIGGSGSGKTTMSETILFNGGIINRKGSIEAKNTACDYKEVELDRGNSVYSSLLYTEHKNTKINFIDTPGFDDFVGEVITALHVMDTAMMVVNAQNGIEVGTEINWRNTKNANKPVFFAVNQLEHEKANFDDVYNSLKENFGSKVMLAQFPIASGADFNAIIDVLSMKMYKYTGDSGKSEVTEIPADFAEKAEEMRAELIEAAAESDEALMEKFFEEGTLTDNEFAIGLKNGIRDRGLFPVLCTSSKKNIGIDLLLDFIVTNISNPQESNAPKTVDGEELAIDSSKQTSLFTFKTSVEPHLGEVCYFKVISGKITEGEDLINQRTQNKERITQLLAIAGKNRNKVTSISAGDIGATIKMKDTKNNDTLNVKDLDYEVEKIIFPTPKYRTAIKAINSSDDEKLGESLNQLKKEDSALVAQYSKELKQLIIEGQGELHLNIVKWYLDNIFKVETEFLAPKIPYRETITKSAKSMYRHKKQSGGAGQFGEVHIMIEPYEENKPYFSELSVRGKDIHKLPWGGVLEYVNCIVGGSIDARFFPAILKGFMERMEEGPLTGSYARDIRVYVHDGKMHPVDSNEISFKLAGRNSLSDAFKKAGPKILEPIYMVEVFVPEERMGDVMTDLQGRRAIILGMEGEGKYQRIRAKVPLAEMNKYATALSSLSNGRAMYSMKFDEYQQVPADVQDKLLKEYEEQQED